MAVKPYAVAVKADFGTLVRSAGKASRELTDLFKEATKKGFSNIKLRGMQQEFEKQFQRERKLREDLIHREARLRAEEEGTLLQLRKKSAETIAKLEEELNEKIEDKKVKSEKQAQLKLAKIQHAIYEEGDEFVDNLNKSMTELKKVTRSMEKASKSAAGMSKYYDRTAARISKVTKIFTDETGKAADDFVERLTHGMDGLISKLTGSINAGDLIKGGASAASGGLGAMGDAVGTVMPMLGKALGVLGGVVSVLGVVAGAVLDVDKRIKEFNKSAINTFGSLDMLRLGGGDLNKGLMLLNRTVHDLPAALGQTTEEVMGLLDALNKGGVSLEMLTGHGRTAVEQQESLTRAIVNLGTTARVMGVGVSDYATTLTEYVNDLGMSLDTVNSSFSQIAKMANESSFGTRRFYSMVVQATAGQSSLNTRLEDTAGLLMRMTKILGQKKAMEMMGQHTSNLAGMSTQDRTRMLLQAGGRQRGVISGAARSQARSFSQNAVGSGADLGKALRDARLGPEIANAIAAAGNATGPEAVERTTSELIKALRDMTGQGRQDTINALINNPATEQQGRGLRDLVRLVEGMSGSLGQQSEALTALGPRGSLLMAISSVEGVIGHSFDATNHNDVAQLMATEQIANMSSATRQATEALLSNSVSNYHELQRAADAGVRADGDNYDGQMEMVKRLGAAIDANGHMVQASVQNGHVVAGAAITNARDMIFNADATDGGGEARSAQEALMYETYNATVSIGDILESKIYQALLDIADVVGGPLVRFLAETLHMDTSAVDTNKAITQALHSGLNELSKAQTDLAKTTVEWQQATGPQKQALTQKKTQQEATIAQLQQRKQALLDARGRISGGNRYDVRTGAGYRATGVRQGRAGATPADQARMELRSGTGYTTPQATTENVDLGLFATREDAQRAAGPGGRVGGWEEGTLRPEDAVARIIQRAAESSGAPASAAAPAANAAPATVAPVPGTTTAPAAPAASATAAPTVAVVPSTADTNPVATTQVATAVRESASETSAALVLHQHGTNASSLQTAAAGRAHIERVLTRETKLGDSLARSKLPAAIAEAQAKQQLMALGTAAGLNPEDAAAAAEQFMSQGTMTDALTQGLLNHPELETSGQTSAVGIGNMAARQSGGNRFRVAGTLASAAAAPEVTSDVDDFIYRGNGANGSITPINTADQFVGMKPGGAVDRAMTGQGGGGGNVTIQINGGDPRQVFDTVKRVLRESGIGTTRTGSNA